MSKRSNPATPSPAKSKKVKIDKNQPRLDTFFNSPKCKAPAAKNLPPQIIDVDELETPVAIVQAKERSSPAPRMIFGQAVPAVAPESFPPLDVDPVSFALPSKLASSHAPYSLLTHALVTLSQTRSRIAIINVLTNLLRIIIVQYPPSLLATVYLVSNSLAPSFIPVELGLGSSIITQAIQQISGLSHAAIRKIYNRAGDPGDVAFEAKVNIRTLIPHPPLTIAGVYNSMRKIASCKGQGASKEKQKLVQQLLLAANGEEVRYLTRTLCQNLRVGAVRTSILTALARAMVHASGIPAGDEDATPVESKANSKVRNVTPLYIQAESLIKQVFVKHPSYDDIVPALLNGGLADLAQRVPLTVGIPLLPMLGSPSRSLHEIYERLGNLSFSAEFKYDGQRAQVHASQVDGCKAVKLFSRHLEDMTSKYPDVVFLVESMMDEKHTTSFILDAEIVAIDPSTGVLKSFQELSNRARKDVNLADIEVSVCLFAFDFIFLNGEPLLGRTFRERRELLKGTFASRRKYEPTMKVAQFDFVSHCDSEEGRDVVEDFFIRAVESKCEGLMIKLLDRAPTEEKKQGRSKSLPSTYEPDIRTSAWLKLKKDYVDGMGDSIDVVPVGAWHGNGRKAQWWSPILLALWDPEREKLVAVCKCMSGFTDAFYKSLTERYPLSEPDACSSRPQWECDFGGFRPDVYFKPQEVWEIRGADITESPVSTAAKGLTESSRGLSIRFPRFIRTREDKTIMEANTPAFLADILRKQMGSSQTGPGNDDGDLIDILESEVEYGSDESCLS